MKNREKTLLAGMLCLTLMAGLLTGCGGKEESVGNENRYGAGAVGCVYGGESGD